MCPRVHPVEQLTKQLRALCDTTPECLIAIGGFGGSGKTTLAEHLCGVLSATVFQSDDFCVPTLGHADLERLRIQVLEPLRRGQPARHQRFYWSTGTLEEWQEVPPSGPVIVEGVAVLSPALLPYYDVTIRVECPQDVAVRRGVARDLEVHGVDTRDQWRELWIPREREYVQTHRPMDVADFIVNTNDRAIR